MKQCKVHKKSYTSFLCHYTWHHTTWYICFYTSHCHKVLWSTLVVVPLPWSEPASSLNPHMPSQSAQASCLPPSSVQCAPRPSNVGINPPELSVDHHLSRLHPSLAASTWLHCLPPQGPLNSLTVPPPLPSLRNAQGSILDDLIQSYALSNTLCWHLPMSCFWHGPLPCTAGSCSTAHMASPVQCLADILNSISPLRIPSLPGLLLLLPRPFHPSWWQLRSSCSVPKPTPVVLNFAVSLSLPLSHSIWASPQIPLVLYLRMYLKSDHSPLFALLPPQSEPPLSCLEYQGLPLTGVLAATLVSYSLSPTHSSQNPFKTGQVMTPVSSNSFAQNLKHSDMWGHLHYVIYFCG